MRYKEVGGEAHGDFDSLYDYFENDNDMSYPSIASSSNAKHKSRPPWMPKRKTIVEFVSKRDNIQRISKKDLPKAEQQ